MAEQVKDLVIIGSGPAGLQDLTMYYERFYRFDPSMLGLTQDDYDREY